MRWRRGPNESRFRRAGVGACLVATGLLLTACASSGTKASATRASDTPSSDAASAARIGPTAKTSSPTTTGGTKAKTLRPVAKHPVPPPVKGNVHTRVSPGKLVVRPAVPLTATASFGGRVTASVVAVKAVHATAKLPGEISGPALSIAVRITDGSSAPVDLSGFTVTVSDAAREPGIPFSGPTGLTGTLDPGKSTTGMYLFAISDAHRVPITITVSSATSSSVLLFTGNAAK